MPAYGILHLNASCRSAGRRIKTQYSHEKYKRSIEVKDGKIKTMAEKNLTVYSLNYCYQQKYNTPEGSLKPFIDDSLLCTLSDDRSHDICLVRNYNCILKTKIFLFNFYDNIRKNTRKIQIFSTL